MPYINTATGQIVRLPVTTSTSQKSSSTDTSQNSLLPVDTTTTSQTVALSTLGQNWHKALLWFLGAVLLIALAGPAPNIATMLLLIIIVGVLLGSWSKYAKFLGLANAVTGGTSNV